LKQPLVVHRLSADQKALGDDWDYSIALTSRPVTLEPSKHSERSYVVDVDLSGELGIYRNRGKQFLREHFLKADEPRGAATRKSAEIHRQTLLAAQGHPMGPVVCNPDGITGFPFRWASGGSLVLVSWAKRWWVLAFFRDIRPIGWNLANGASESTEEQKNVFQLIERETMEEVVIVDGDPREPTARATLALRLNRYPDLHDERIDLARRLQERHHQLRKAQDGFHLDPPSERWLPVEPVLGPAEIRVSDGKGAPSVVGHNLYVTVDPLDFGIEVIQIVKVRLDDSAYILDGEVVDVDTPGREPWLARRPAGLLSLAYLRECWERNARSLGRALDDANQHGKRFGGKQLPTMTVSKDLAHTDLYVFEHDYAWRRRAQGALLQRHDAWLNEFGPDFDALHSKGIASPGLHTLCPVTWKVLEQALARGDLPE
jgi:hypothetical protein